MDKLKSILLWLYCILMTLLVSLPILLCSTILLPLNPNRTWAHAIGNFWGWSIFSVNPGWKLTITGKENLLNTSSVLVSNHESVGDIIALYLLRTKFKWLAKKELFKIPFFGWSMYFCGYIPLERGSMRSARKSFDKAKDYLKKNVPILFFPEGTRSTSGSLGKFKSGAFKLAIQEQVPINCIALTGTRDVVKKGSRSINRNIEIKLKVLPPIETKGLDETNVDELKDKSRNLIEKALKELKG